MPVDIQEQYDKVYRYCCFRTRDSRLAEDLTQEAFLRYFASSSYISRGKPLAYLYTIAKNLCVDRCRQTSPLPLPEELPGSDPFAALERNLALAQAVAGLPADWQEAVLLRYANDLSMGEISRITGLSRFAVRRRLEAAVKQLKQTLREEDFA